MNNIGCRCLTLLEGWVVYMGIETALLGGVIGFYIGLSVLYIRERFLLRKAKAEWKDLKSRAH